MTIEEALAHFKSPYELCKKINAAQSNFTRWKKQNFIPVAQQIKIKNVTDSYLPIDLSKASMELRIQNEDLFDHDLGLKILNNPGRIYSCAEILNELSIED